VSGSTTTPVVPAGASTATKILITLAAILGVIAGVTWPTGVSPDLGAYAGVGAVILTAVSGIVHSVWDHSP
jgi:hypothetical protein